MIIALALLNVAAITFLVLAALLFDRTRRQMLRIAEKNAKTAADYDEVVGRLRAEVARIIEAPE